MIILSLFLYKHGKTVVSELQQHQRKNVYTIFNCHYQARNMTEDLMIIVTNYGNGIHHTMVTN